MSILLSVVSHRQADLVHGLLGDIERFCLYKDMEVVVTINVQEKIPFKEDDFNFKIRVIQNEHPKGFGANHNAAFRCKGLPLFLCPESGCSIDSRILFFFLPLYSR